MRYERIKINLKLFPNSLTVIYFTFRNWKSKSIRSSRILFFSLHFVFIFIRNEKEEEKKKKRGYVNKNCVYDEPMKYVIELLKYENASLYLQRIDYAITLKQIYFGGLQQGKKGNANIWYDSEAMKEILIKT